MNKCCKLSIWRRGRSMKSWNQSMWRLRENTTKLEHSGATSAEDNFAIGAVGAEDTRGTFETGACGPQRRQRKQWNFSIWAPKAPEKVLNLERLGSEGAWVKFRIKAFGAEKTTCSVKLKFFWEIAMFQAGEAEPNPSSGVNTGFSGCRLRPSTFDIAPEYFLFFVFDLRDPKRRSLEKRIWYVGGCMLTCQNAFDGCIYVSMFVAPSVTETRFVAYTQLNAAQSHRWTLPPRGSFCEVAYANIIASKMSNNNGCAFAKQQNPIIWSYDHVIILCLMVYYPSTWRYKN